MTGQYTFVTPERQNELTRRIQQKLSDASKKLEEAHTRKAPSHRAGGSSKLGGHRARNDPRAVIPGSGLSARPRRVDNVSRGKMAFKSTDDPRLEPAYTLAEAAHYLRMPEGTLRSWVVGRLYPVAGRTKRSRSLIHLDDPKKQYLSFVNLVEGHVLAAIRRRDGLKLPKVRNALDYVHRQFRVEHPLINQAFQTDGLDLFVERYGELINASRE